MSGCSESLLYFACTLMYFIIITCDSNLQYHLTIQLSLMAARLRLSSSAVFARLSSLLPRGLSSRLEVASCQGTISRVRRSVAPETLLINNGNVFHLSRCCSTSVRCYDLSLWEFYGLYCNVSGAGASMVTL
jgi:hypothetical protein